MIGRKFFAVILFVLPLISFGQSDPTKLYSTPIPPPPDAASLSIFGNHSIDLFNGVPQVSIPLWTVKAGDLSVPISVDYNAGGVTVSQVPSWVGIGLSLNAGGMISRSINSVADNHTFGFLATEKIRRAPDSYLTSEYQQFIDGTDGLWDTEPDLFNYSFPGGSGQFAFDQEGQIHNLPNNKVKITASNPGSIGVFTIVDETGIIYKFEKAEKMWTIPGPTYSVSSVWHLTSIHSPTSAQTITFEYESFTCRSEQPLSETKTENYPPFDKRQTLTILQSPGYRIKRIVFPLGSVEFTAGAYRSDLEGSQLLEEVAIKDNSGNVTKKFKFDYFYFYGNGIRELSYYANTTATTPADTKLRLALRKITEFDKNNLSKPPYILEYESSVGLPDRLESKAIDHWGFYNGANDNTTLIPRRIYSNGMLMEGGDRRVNEDFAKAGSLKKLTYPTGGATFFEYESNRVGPYFSMPMNLEEINVNANVATCTIAPATFEVNDEGGQSVLFTMKLIGSVFSSNPPSCTNGTSPIVVTDANTYLFLRIFEVSNPLSPQQVYLSSGDMTIDGTNKNGQVLLTLPNGIYSIKFYKAGIEATSRDAVINGAFSVNLKGYRNVKGAPFAGGLRIKEMRDFDPETNKKVTKSYQYINDDGYSSGIINEVPKYDYRVGVLGETGGVMDVMFWTSSSNSKNSQSIGGNIGYSKVSVLFGKDSTTAALGTNGKTDYYYSVPIDRVNRSYTLDTVAHELWSFHDWFVNNSLETNYGQGVVYPFAPTLSMNWRRGALEKQVDYKKVGTMYKKVKEIVNTYKDNYFGEPKIFNPSTDVVGLKLAKHMINNSGSDNGTKDWVVYQYYYLPSRCYKLVKSEEYDYDANGDNPVITTQEIAYDNLAHLQPTRTITTQSDGKKKVAQTLYPADYSNTTGFIQELQQANMVAKPIEMVSYLTNADGSNVQVGAATLTSYLTGSKIGLPEKVWKLETRRPIPLADFKFSNQALKGTLAHVGTKTAFDLSTKDTHYPLMANVGFEFDLAGNIATVQRKDDIPTSYLWAYCNSMPIAEVKNAVLNPTSQAWLSYSYPIADNNLVSSGLDPIFVAMPNTNTFTLAYAQTIQLGVKVTHGTTVSPAPYFALAIRNSQGKTWLTKQYGSQSTTGATVISDLLALPADTYTFFYTYNNTSAPQVNPQLTCLVDIQQVRQQVFHTSFEEDKVGMVIGEARTGKQSHTGNFTVLLPAQAGNYTLSYWTKGGNITLSPASTSTTTGLTQNGWTYYECTYINLAALTNLSITTGAAKLDELRFFPQGRPMTTYTYDPFVGMTSATDANNVTLYYEYDGFGRLQYVRDQDGNIVKNYVYHYKGQ